jgi:hypothetical protein
LDKIVANFHLNDGTDPGKAVDHNRDQSAVAQAEKIRLIGRLCVIGWFLGNGDALEQRMGFLRRQDRPTPSMCPAGPVASSSKRLARPPQTLLTTEVPS